MTFPFFKKRILKYRSSSKKRKYLLPKWVGLNLKEDYCRLTDRGTKKNSALKKVISLLKSPDPKPTSLAYRKPTEQDIKKFFNI